MIKVSCYLFVLLFLVGANFFNVAQSTPKLDTVELWTKGLPNHPPLVESNTKQLLNIKGKMVLITSHQIADIKSGKLADTFISLVRETSEKLPAEDIKNYHIIHDNRDWVFDPQFSPDGTKVLFKDGWPWDRNGTYKLYIFDPKTEKLQSGPSKLMTFPITKWSPDGRYILFVSGGDIFGGDDNSYYPRTLYVFDTANSQTYEIDSSPRSKYYFWTKDDTVIYMKGSRVFERSANGFKHQLVLGYADNLEVSPDGNYLLYQGYKDSDIEEKVIKRLSQPQKAPGIEAPEPIDKSHFCIYDRKENKKYFFNEDLREAQFIWMHGVTDKVIALRSTVPLGGGEITISMVDLPTGKEHKVVTLPTLKGDQGFSNDLYAQTQPIAVTKDNNYLIIKRIEQGISQLNPWHVKRYYQAVNLSDGEVVTIMEDAMHTWFIEGFDWN